MSNFAIITDSACDLPRALREKFGIEDYVQGVVIYPDGHSERADLDWENITPREFYGSMKSKDKFCSTAQPAPQDFIDVFEKTLKEGRDVLYISISTGLSGTYGTSCIAAEDLREKYPERKIFCVDSLRYCGGQGMLVIRASELRAAGKTIEETAAWLEENRLCIHQMGVLEDLFFSKRMGRVSGTAAVMGTLVGVRPLADINEKGMSDVTGKVKGRKAAYNATIEFMKRTIINPEEQVILISHSEREEQAQIFKQMVEETFHPKEIYINPVSQACGPGIGPGMYAVYYFGTKVTEGLAEEKRIFAEVSK